MSIATARSTRPGQSGSGNMLSYEYDPVFDQIEDLFGDPLWAYDDESSKNPGQSTATQTTALSGKTKSSPSRSGPSTLNNSDNVNYLTRTYEVNGNSISRSYGDGGGRLTRQSRSAELTRFAEQASTTSPKPSEEAPSKRPDDQHDRPKKSEAAKAGSHHHTVTSSIEQVGREEEPVSRSEATRSSTPSSPKSIGRGKGEATHTISRYPQHSKHHKWAPPSRTTLARSVSHGLPTHWRYDPSSSSDPTGQAEKTGVSTKSHHQPFYHCNSTSTVSRSAQKTISPGLAPENGGSISTFHLSSSIHPSTPTLSFMLPSPTPLNNPEPFSASTDPSPNANSSPLAASTHSYSPFPPLLTPSPTLSSSFNTSSQSSRTKNSSSPSLSLQYTSRFPKSTLSSENCIAYGYGSARYYTCKQLQNHAGSSSSGTNRPSGVETFSPDPVTKSQKSAKSESAVATGTTKPTSASTGSEANHAFSADDTSQTRTHSVLSQSSASKSSSQSRTYSFSSTDHQRTDSPTPSADPLKPVETNALPHDPLHSNGKMDDQQTSTLQHKDPNSPDRTSLTAEQGNVGESSVSRKSISGPATLGIVIGSFVFLASLAAIVFFLLKKRRREKEKERLDGCGNQSKLDEEWGGMIAPFPVASRAGAQALGHTDDEMHDIPLDSGPAYDQSFHRQVSTSIYPNVATRNEDPFGDHSIRRGPPGGQAQLSSDSAIRNRHMESPRIVGDGLGGFTSSYPPSMERQETSPQLTRPLNIVPKKMGHRPNNSQNTNVTMATTDTAGFTHGGCTASDSSSSLSISDVGHLHSIEIRNATKVPAPDQPVVATNGWFGIRMLQPLWGGTDGKPKKPDPDDEVREEEDDHPVEKERTPIPKDRQDRDPDEHGHGKDVTIFFSQSNGLTPHHFAVDSKGADFVPKTQGPWYRPAQGTWLASNSMDSSLQGTRFSKSPARPTSRRPSMKGGILKNAISFNHHNVLQRRDHHHRDHPKISFPMPVSNAASPTKPSKVVGDTSWEEEEEVMIEKISSQRSSPPPPPPPSKDFPPPEGLALDTTTSNYPFTTTTSSSPPQRSITFKGSSLPSSSSSSKGSKTPPLKLAPPPPTRLPYKRCTYLSTRTESVYSQDSYHPAFSEQMPGERKSSALHKWLLSNQPTKS